MQEQIRPTAIFEHVANAGLASTRQKTEEDHYGKPTQGSSLRFS